MAQTTKAAKAAAGTRAFARHILIDEIRVGTAGAFANAISFKYLCGKYKHVTREDVVTEVVEDIAKVKAADFFLDQAKSGLIRNGDLITIVDAPAADENKPWDAEAKTVTDVTSKVQVTFTKGLPTAVALVAR